MAKVTFTKLGLTKDTGVSFFNWNDQTIEVKRYLPIEEKLELITNVINNCQDENNFINEAKLHLFYALEMVYRYTNISFTDKQKEDPAKLYDLLSSSGFLTAFEECISKEEKDFVFDSLYSSAANIYEYRNSVYAILDALKNDYDGLNFDADGIREKLAGSDLGLLKDVLTKLG